jgi:hypothetical protein
MPAQLQHVHSILYVTVYAMSASSRRRLSDRRQLTHWLLAETVVDICQRRETFKSTRDGDVFTKPAQRFRAG